MVTINHHKEMAKLSKHEAIGVSTVLVVTFAFLFFGNYIFNKAESVTDKKVTEDATVVGEVFGSPNLEVKDLAAGSGAEVKNGDTVSVHYVGMLTDRSKFDSSYDRGEPISFTVGSGQLIRGFDTGVVGMQVGGKRQLTIPPELGYGAAAAGAIPANSTLIFEVELVKIEN